ncbi:MAG: HpaII family restriction endonuclease [Clostridiales bacterium]|jgi:hypothetical protein|nr:HpaII family restriction endonuclease [Clostridiales bacterium]
MIKGNRGEWSEIYVLLKLLGEGKVYAADENLKPLDLHFPILEVIREETPGEQYKYIPATMVKVFAGNVQVAEYLASEFTLKAAELLNVIMASGEASFPATNIEAFMGAIKCKKLKSPPPNIGNARLGKTDITMKVHDPNTRHEPVCGFSIKSELGHAPTLLNAGRTTNFIYEVKGLTVADIAEINAIDTRTKIIDRMKAIRAKGEMIFLGLNDDAFASNLEIVDSSLEKILAYALSYYYDDEAITCSDAVALLTKRNPLNARTPRGYYAVKFKKFLTAIALGMVPSKPWDGRDEAAGGYIIVTQSGDVLAYHIYNRDSFEEYLLKNTKFERASTTRHDFASLYTDGVKTYINLNMQIRFIK